MCLKTIKSFTISLLRNLWAAWREPITVGPFQPDVTRNYLTTLASQQGGGPCPPPSAAAKSASTMLGSQLAGQAEWPHIKRTDWRFWTWRPTSLEATSTRPLVIEPSGQLPWGIILWKKRVIKKYKIISHIHCEREKNTSSTGYKIKHYNCRPR